MAPRPPASASGGVAHPPEEAESRRTGTEPTILAVVTPPPAERPARARSRPPRVPRPRDRSLAQAPADPPSSAATTAPVATGAEALGEAERLLAEGRAKEACLRGEQLLAAAPDTADVLRFLGRCYMRTRRRGAALASYRRYLDLAPDAPDATLIRSIVE